MANGLTFALPFWVVNRSNSIDQPEPEPNRLLATECFAEPETNRYTQPFPAAIRLGILGPKP